MFTSYNVVVILTNKFFRNTYYKKKGEIKMYSNYYNYNPYLNYRNDNQMESLELITLNEAINLIRKSVGDEKSDELFYEQLINMAPNNKSKEIIASIGDDEKKHHEILKDLYYSFTGNSINDNNNQYNNMNLNMNYKDSLEKALFGELEAVEKYRKILSKMPSGKAYTLLMAIMTDEMKHANKYNFLIATMPNNS